MRRLVLLLACAGCPTQGNSCEVDLECDAAEVCARDHTCVDPSAVRATRTTWTIAGQPPDMTNCGDYSLQILFKVFANDASEDKLGFSPVPCFLGQFMVDKLPIRYTTVLLLDDRTHQRIEFAEFDADGNAEIDLPAP